MVGHGTSGLGWCNFCRENSIVVKCYSRRGEDSRQRFEFCINKGCGFKQELPFAEESISGHSNAVA